MNNGDAVSLGEGEPCGYRHSGDQAPEADGGHAAAWLSGLPPVCPPVVSHLLLQLFVWDADARAPLDCFPGGLVRPGASLDEVTLFSREPCATLHSRRQVAFCLLPSSLTLLLTSPLHPLCMWLPLPGLSFPICPGTGCFSLHPPALG